MAEYQRLDEACHINMGQSPDSKSYNQEGVGLPFFQGNADFGAVHPETRVWCSSPTKIVEAGTLLISVRAPIGALNFAKERSCIGRGLAGITPQNGVSLKYIYYCLKGKNKELNAKGTGSTFKAIAKSALGETSVKIVSEEDQLKIIQTLDRVSSVIEARKQQLTELDNLIKARFVEMFGDMYLDTMEWRELHLETMADIVSGITKGRKIAGKQLTKVPYMAVSNVKDGYIDWTTVKTIEATDQEINQYRLLPDDVLMTEGGDPDKLGRGAIIRTPLENCIHQNHIFRVRLDESHILPDYFAEYLKHQRAKRYFLGCAKQTTGIASINMKQLKALPVLLPPLELQNEFSAFIRQIDKSKVVVQKALSKNVQYFTI
ncbi:MAG: restriction endonuclease subunit S [Hominicoprocola sp.]